MRKLLAFTVVVLLIVLTTSVYAPLPTPPPSPGDSGSSSQSCGNGITEGTEQCDDANTDNTDACVSCVAAFCRDGFTQTGVEQCDDGNTVNEDACTNTCKTPTCSDDIQNQGETGVDCGGSCPNACQTSGSSSSGLPPPPPPPGDFAYCGDGIPDAGEECDDGNRIDTDACDNGCFLQGGNDDVRTGLPAPPPAPGVTSGSTSGTTSGGTTSGGATSSSTSSSTGSTSTGSTGTSTSGGTRTSRNALQTRGVQRNSVQPQLDPQITTPVPSVPIAPSTPRTIQTTPAYVPPVQQSVPEEPVSLVIIISISSVVLIICLGATYAVLHYMHSKNVPVEVISYIDSNLKQGYSAEELKRNLITTGWSQSVVESALKKIQHA